MVAQRGTMVSGGGAEDGEEQSITAESSYPLGEADAVAAGQRTEELDVVYDGIGDRQTSAISRSRV